MASFPLTDAGPGAIGVSDTDRQCLPEPTELDFGSDGWFVLSPGHYLVTFNEVVNLPRWLMALGRPRSSLLRMGVSPSTPPCGTPATAAAPRRCWSSTVPPAFSLQRHARIAQLVFFPLSAPDARKATTGAIPRREPVNAAPDTTVDPAQLRRWVDAAAADAGFDLVAVASADDFASDREEALRRIDAGLMDGLPWFNPAACPARHRS